MRSSALRTRPWPRRTLPEQPASDPFQVPLVLRLFWHLQQVFRLWPLRPLLLEQGSFLHQRPEHPSQVRQRRVFRQQLHWPQVF